MRLNKFSVSIALASVLVLSSGTADALDYALIGPINSISATTMNVIDTQIKLSPTVKVYDAKGKPMQLDQLKPGTLVRVKTLSLGSGQLVDSIQVLK